MKSQTFSYMHSQVFWCLIILTSWWCHAQNFLKNLNSNPKSNALHQIWAWSSHYLENYSSFFIFLSKKGCDTLELKVVIETPKNNEHFQLMQNMSQRCKVNVEKRHLIILWRFGVIEKNLRGGIPPGIDRVKYASKLNALILKLFNIYSMET